MKSAVAEAHSDLLLFKVEGYDTGHLQSERGRYERQCLICSVTSWDLRDSLRSRFRYQRRLSLYNEVWDFGEIFSVFDSAEAPELAKIRQAFSECRKHEQDQAVNEYLKSEFRYHGMKRFVLKAS
jgi:hypothetical protein